MLSPLRRSIKVSQHSPYLFDYHYYFAIISLFELTTFKEARTDSYWQQAMKDELQALEEAHTWDLVNLSLRKSLVGCKWVYKIKTHFDGFIEC